MQLKTVGESLYALRDINNVLKLNDVSLSISNLTQTLSGYSKEATIAALEQSTLNKEQVEAILVSKGLQGEELKDTADKINNAIAARQQASAQREANREAMGFRAGMKGLGASIKSFVAMHPALVAITATIGALYAVSKIYDAFTTSASERTKKLESQINKATTAYNEITSSLEKVNSQLEENKQRIDELNKIEKPTYIEDEELEKLKIANQYLKEQKETLEKAEKAKAQEIITAEYNKFKTDFFTNKTKTYKDVQDQDSKNIRWWINAASKAPIVGKRIVNGVAKSSEYETEAELLQDSINNLKYYQKAKDKIIQEGFNNDYGNISIAGVSLSLDPLKNTNEQIEKYSKEVSEYQTKILSLYSTIAEYDPNFESEEAKEVIKWLDNIDANINPDEFGKKLAERISNSDTFEKIGNNIYTKIQDGVYSEQDLMDDANAQEIINKMAKQFFEAENGLTLDDKDIDFLHFVQNTDGVKELLESHGLTEDNIDDYVKRITSYLYQSLKEGTGVNEQVKKSLKSFEDIWNSSDFSDAKDKLLELAKAGTISAETIKSTEDYKSLINDTGLTAEQATRKIMDMLSVQEKLSAASSGIKSLENAYKEFKDENIGFVTASTLESLPNVFKTLKTYDFSLFEQIVGDPKSGVDKIQQAFNDIVTAYIVEQGTMNGLLNASESEINSYIANLKQMGITNAEEVVANAQQSLRETGILLAESEKEYVKYLNNKEGYDVNYINSNLSKNGQLISQLGSAYKDDYNNWCELLKKKAEAYNQFVSAINKAQYNTLSSKNISSVEHAQEIVNESEGKVPKDLAKSPFGFTNKSLQNVVMGDAAARFGSGMQTISEYTSAEIKAAKEYLATIKDYDAVFEELNLDLVEANLNLNSGFNYISPSSSSSSSSYDSSSNSDTSENFDWIERRIKKLIDALNDLKDSADDTYSTWANRSNALVNAINTTRQAIDLQQQAYNRYMQQAESVGLSSVYKNLVQNGALDISTISDENLKNAINQYKQWYDKAQDCLETQKDLKDSLNELNSKKFDNIQSIFNFDKEKIEHFINNLNKQIDILQLKSLFANESYYNEMLNYTQKEINSLANERTQLVNVMNSSGLSQDSEAWQNMYSTIIKIDEEMQDLNKDMVEFNNNIRNLNWEVFEYLEESLGRITDETEYFINLLADKDLFDDNGNLNKYANATVALYATAYDTYKQQAQDYFEEMRDLERQVVAGAGKDVLEQYNKMVKAHQDAVLAANKEKKAILDLIEEGYKAQLNAIQKVIDKKKEQLNMEKNLYDYQKSITEKTKNIASLEKQQVSLADDNSEETMAKIQQIKVQLEEAKTDLEETEYEQYLKDSQDMLDQLATDYENWMNERLDNEDALLSEIVGEINSEGFTIKSTLKEVAKENGTALSTSLNTVFSATSPFTATLTNSINGVKNAVAGTTTAINNLLNKVASITGTSVSGTNAGTKSSSNTNSTPNNSSGSYGTNNNNSSSNNRNNNTGTNSNSNTNNSNGLVAGIFISKSDSYPKSKLDKEHSIVDRLKYFNFDSSFSARSQYFSKLGGSGTYRGSSSQNTWLISQMKLKGYKKGTYHVPKKDNYLIQEDGQELIYDKSEGSFVTPQSSEPTIVPLNVGDMVFPNESVKRLYELASSGNFGGFANNLTPSINPIAENMKKMSDSLQTTNNINTSNEIYMDGDININLPGVTNYEQFRKELIGDDKFEKAIFTMVGNGMLGKSTIEKYKYVR